MMQDEIQSLYHHWKYTSIYVRVINLSNKTAILSKNSSLWWLNLADLPWIIREDSSMKTGDSTEAAENSQSQQHTNYLTGEGITRDEVLVKKVPGSSETCYCGYHSWNYKMMNSYLLSI